MIASFILAVAAMELVAKPSASALLLDGRCDDGEYRTASHTDLGHGVTLHAMHDEHFITLCASLPPDSLGTMDLYLQSPNGGPITDLHISAQVGERTYMEGENPEFRWGNFLDWYGPPVAFSGTELRPDGRARPTFADAQGREIRLSKKRFGQGPWHMRIEFRAIGPGKANAVRQPEQAGEWVTLRLL